MVHTTALGSDVDPKSVQIRELFAVIVDRMMAKGVTLEDFERMLLTPEVEDRVLRAINPNALLNDEVRVYVDYTMPSDRATLEAKFSKHGVGATFYNGAEWQLHPSCVGMDQTPGERVMLLKWFNRRISSENAIAEMDTLGYRPGTHLEAYAIAKANPELQRLFWIAALGSFAIDGNACVAVLLRRSSQLVLRAFSFSVDWGEDQRFLFVRKQS